MPATRRYVVKRTEEVEVTAPDNQPGEALRRAEAVFLNPTPDLHSYSTSRPRVTSVTVEEKF